MQLIISFPSLLATTTSLVMTSMISQRPTVVPTATNWPQGWKEAQRAGSYNEKYALPAIKKKTTNFWIRSESLLQKEFTQDQYLQRFLSSRRQFSIGYPIIATFCHIRRWEIVVELDARKGPRVRQYDPIICDLNSKS